MHTLTLSLVARNLRDACEILSTYPHRTVRDVLDRLGASLVGVPVDLLDLCGAEACEAIEAEVLVMQEGWAA